MIDYLWGEIKEIIWKYDGKFQKIGFPEKGSTGYYSANITKEEIEKVDGILQILNVNTLNTRIIKIEDNHYKVLIASVTLKTSVHFAENTKIELVWGDFSPFLRRMVKNLEKAIPHAANKN